jgi:peptidoglycan/xylan/chitin deacetylase (PgdA/CDA1 family)
MPSLSYILNLKARGFGKTIKRAMSMINRDGFTSEKMERNVVGFVNLLVGYDAKTTFPITARTIEKHTDFIKSIYKYENAIVSHGYFILFGERYENSN